MGAIGGGLGAVLPMVVGAVAGRIIANKLSGKVNSTILGAGQIGAGLVLPMVVKNNFVKGIGTGMIINGSLSLAQSTGVISAVSGVGEMEVDFISGSDESSELDSIASVGYYDEGTMSGSADLSIISGDMEDMYDDM